MNLLKHLLFEDPMALWILFAMVAVLAGVWWSRGGSRAALITVLAAVAAGVTVGLLAWLVETDYEKIERTLAVMARGVGTGDADKIIERVSPQYRNGLFTKDMLATVIRRGMEEVRATVRQPTIVMADGQATVTQVYTFTPAPGSHAKFPTGDQPVQWEGGFARDPDGEWRLVWARATQPVRMTPEEAIVLLGAAKAM
jgi:hypothetical protein